MAFNWSPPLGIMVTHAFAYITPSLAMGWTQWLLLITRTQHKWWDVTSKIRYTKTDLHFARPLFLSPYSLSESPFALSHAFHDGTSYHDVNFPVRIPHSKQLRPSVWQPQGTESGQQPCEWAWKWILPQSSADMTTVPNASITAHKETWAQV